MRGYGGLITFLIKDADWRQTADVVDAVRDSTNRPQPRRRQIADRTAMVMSYHGFSKEQLAAVGIRENMIRLSCGLENPEDLIADLSRRSDR